MFGARLSYHNAFHMFTYSTVTGRKCEINIIVIVIIKGYLLTYLLTLLKYEHWLSQLLDNELHWLDVLPRCSRTSSPLYGAVRTGLLTYFT